MGLPVRTGLLIAGLAGGLAACGGGPGSPGTAGSEAPAVASPATGVPAPGFRLETPDGQAVDLADRGDQVWLIDFWATWCAPCREEIPMLGELQSAYGPRGFRVLAVSEEDAAVLRDYAAATPLPYTSLVGTAEVFEAYGVLALPMAYLIDRQGRIAESFVGPKPRKVLQGKIESLLAAEG